MPVHNQLLGLRGKCDMEKKRNEIFDARTATCGHVSSSHLCSHRLQVSGFFFLSTPGGQPAALLTKDRELLHEWNKYLLECSS